MALGESEAGCKRITLELKRAGSDRGEKEKFYTKNIIASILARTPPCRLFRCLDNLRWRSTIVRQGRIISHRHHKCLLFFFPR